MPALPVRAALTALAVLLVSGCATPGALGPRPSAFPESRASAGGLSARAARSVSPHAEPELVAVRHRVKAGETVYRIAVSYGLRPAELMEANGLKDPRSLAVGQELVIPGAERPQRILAVGDRTESEIRAKPAPRTSPRVQARAVPGRLSERPRLATQGLLQWPLRGVLYGRFGKKGREPHDGIDLAAPEGTPVRTAREGRILFAGEQKGYGNIVIVDHGDNLMTLYAHNRDLRVRTGQKVRDGQVVATVGQSGKTSGPHLHFEVRREGLPVDPLDYLGALPSR
jgi:lipoprotein NlpD